MEIQIKPYIYASIVAIFFADVYLFIHFFFFFFFLHKKNMVQIIRPSVNDSETSSLVYARFAADPYTYNRPPPSQHLRCIGEYNEYTCGKRSQSCITIMYSVYIYPVSRQKLPSFLGIFVYMYMDYACTVALICEGIRICHMQTTIDT